MGIRSWILGEPKVMPTAGAPIAFFIRLDDFDADSGAWRCQALRVPSIHITEVRHRGERIDMEKIRVDPVAHLVFWLGGSADRPEVLAARVEVTSNLVTAAQARDEAKSGASAAAVRVAVVGAIATIAAAVVPSVLGYYSTKSKEPTATHEPPPVHKTAPQPIGSDPGSASPTAAPPLKLPALRKPARQDAAVTKNQPGIAPTPLQLRATFSGLFCQSDAATKVVLKCGFSSVADCKRTESATDICTDKSAVTCFVDKTSQLFCYPSDAGLCDAYRNVSDHSSPCVRFNVPW